MTCNECVKVVHNIVSRWISENYAYMQQVLKNVWRMFEEGLKMNLNSSWVSVNPNLAPEGKMFNDL